MKFKPPSAVPAAKGKISVFIHQVVGRKMYVVFRERTLAIDESAGRR